MSTVPFCSSAPLLLALLGASAASGYETQPGFVPARLNLLTLLLGLLVEPLLDRG